MHAAASQLATIGVLGLLVLSAAPAVAEPPILQTPAPVIYLSDNLAEADQLGWCIDTLGRGFGEYLQAHSCKPQGGDVQFEILPDTGQIRSVAFAEYCMEYVPGADPVFALATCAEDSARQRFAYDPEHESISPADDPTLCVSVEEEFTQAGPFLSRPLLMTSCAETDPILRSWTVLNG